MSGFTWLKVVTRVKQLNHITEVHAVLYTENKKQKKKLINVHKLGTTIFFPLVNP